MRGSISAPFIRYPVGTSLIMVGILFVGLIAYQNLPVAPLPKVDFPTIQVSAQLPGASAETMASSVAQPLERQFAQIPGVTQTTSSSGLGTTTVVVQFDLDRNIDAAANDIQAAINAASGQLPHEPAVAADLSQGQSRRLADPAAVGDLRRPAADRGRRQRRHQAGPADQPDRRRRPSDDRRRAEAGDPHPARSGQARGQGHFAGGCARPARHHDRQHAQGQHRRRGAQLHDLRQRPATQAEAWNDVIIAYRNGAPLRVRDIGQAVAGPEDAKKAAWASGKRGVFLVVFKQPGANVIETVDRIKAELPRLRAAMPPSLKVEILSDRTQTIRASVEDVQLTLLLTIGLVIAVIFMFLRTFWATVIPSVTVPLSLLGACALMYMMSYTLDNISLMALTISVGFVVDDAIVMLENIVRHIEDGMKPYDAALKGSARSPSRSSRSASRWSPCSFRCCCSAASSAACSASSPSRPPCASASRRSLP